MCFRLYKYCTNKKYNDTNDTNDKQVETHYANIKRVCGWCILFVVFVGLGTLYLIGSFNIINIGCINKSDCFGVAIIFYVFSFFPFFGMIFSICNMIDIIPKPTLSI